MFLIKMSDTITNLNLQGFKNLEGFFFKQNN